ncbi:hypothetical protein E2L08_12630 [Palleronia sediminis]|uniref:Tetratricopeptide repeat-like domain-containing protein n=1 Tax=Palleronia sediminis TaxID=2547833 RepID=A0A4R6A7H7_9RHOB|nr:hypothetical protein [Palleronia sediminis]TDL78138.1 hypothetical protein E2L08_12630 [Palleronia sediminis]
MSNSDSFIQEVSEEVRRDRLFGLMRRYGWIAVTAVLILVGGAAWVEWTRATDRAAAQAFGDAIAAALEADNPEDRRAALDGIEATGGQRALVAMLAADTLATPEARAAARADLAAIADDAAVPQVWRELAMLKTAMLMQGDAAPQEVIDLLEPLTIPGAPFRLLAMEQQAIAHVAAGDTDAALAQLQRIAGDDAATRDLQGRVRQLIVSLGGTLETA